MVNVHYVGTVAANPAPRKHGQALGQLFSTKPYYCGIGHRYLAPPRSLVKPRLVLPVVPATVLATTFGVLGAPGRISLKAGLGVQVVAVPRILPPPLSVPPVPRPISGPKFIRIIPCLLYTSDAADDTASV